MSDKIKQTKLSASLPFSNKEKNKISTVTINSVDKNSTSAFVKINRDKISLSRTYRPSNFNDVVAQDVTVRILSNAIVANRFPHALIFTGIRGVGKTTTARIVAKSLNCELKKDANPCGKCDNCVDILNEKHLDIIEMDAASKTSVDDIREIIDSIKYKPVRAKYKVYIIDEVHMLSKSAFNALLKTLEEPPEHIKFIFATTEINKVPKTVLSRCMRFDLQRFSKDQIKNLLKKITSSEGVNIENEALDVLARFADGSARDGVSLLDQAISIDNDSSVTYYHVIKMLGIADMWSSWDLLQKIIRGDSTACINDVNEYHMKGISLEALTTDLADWIHFLTIYKSTKVRDSSIPSEIKIEPIAKDISISILMRYWQIFFKGIEEIKNSYNQLHTMRMLMIKLCYVKDMPTPDKLIQALQGKELNLDVISVVEKNKVNSNIQTKDEKKTYYDDLPENLKADPTLKEIRREFPSMQVKFKEKKDD